MQLVQSGSHPASPRSAIRLTATMTSSTSWRPGAVAMVGTVFHCLRVAQHPGSGRGMQHESTGLVAVRSLRPRLPEGLSSVIALCRWQGSSLPPGSPLCVARSGTPTKAVDPDSPLLDLVCTGAGLPRNSRRQNAIEEFPMGAFENSRAYLEEAREESLRSSSSWPARSSSRSSAGETYRWQRGPD